MPPAVPDRCNGRDGCGRGRGPRRPRSPLGVAVALSLVLQLAASASAEPRYVTEQLTLSVWSEPDGSGEQVAVLHSGDRVELLEQQQDRAHVQLESGREGWVTASYLSTELPVRQQLEARTRELAQAREELGAIRTELNRARASTAAPARLTSQASTPSGAASSQAAGPGQAGGGSSEQAARAGSAQAARTPSFQTAGPATTTGPATPTGPASSGDPSSTDSAPALFERAAGAGSWLSWEWLAGGVLAGLVAGFILGWRLLDRHIRKRYGGLRIY